MRDTSSATNTHIQLLTVNVHIPAVRMVDTMRLLDTFHAVDENVRGYKTPMGPLADKAYVDYKISLLLVLQDQKYMEKFRAALFKTKLKYPNAYTSY